MSDNPKMIHVIENERIVAAEEANQLRDLAAEQQKRIATLIEDKAALLKALRVARIWMPAWPMTDEARSSCAVVDAAIARAEGRAS